MQIELIAYKKANITFSLSCLASGIQIQGCVFFCMHKSIQWNILLRHVVRIYPQFSLTCLVFLELFSCTAWLSVCAVYIYSCQSNWINCCWFSLQHGGLFWIIHADLLILKNTNTIKVEGSWRERCQVGRMNGLVSCHYQCHAKLCLKQLWPLLSRYGGIGILQVNPTTWLPPFQKPPSRYKTTAPGTYSDLIKGRGRTIHCDDISCVMARLKSGKYNELNEVRENMKWRAAVYCKSNWLPPQEIIFQITCNNLISI